MTRLLKLVKEFSTAAEYEVRILKATTFLYTNNEAARKKLRKQKQLRYLEEK